VRRIKPQVIVNAAAYTAVDQAEGEPELARAVNTLAVEVFAEEATKQDALLIHYSTDYVFDGAKTIPYTECDQTNPLNVYGCTKRDADMAIASSGARHIIIRPSWIYGTRGRNFLSAVMQQAAESPELRVVNDQVGAPTWNRVIADATAKIVSQVINLEAGSRRDNLSGVYHLSAAGETTRYGFAAAVLEHLRAGGALTEQRIIPVASEEYLSAARRPQYSVLSNSKIAGSFGIRLADWRLQLKQALRVSESARRRLPEAEKWLASKK
jgi:dTDP-4-dehydrorhamnose reductase